MATTILFPEVQAKAVQLRTHNTNLTETLAYIKNQINALEADWTSDASDTIRGKITEMQSKFDNYKEVIDSYAAHLEKVAAQAEKTEASLVGSAESQFQ